LGGLGFWHSSDTSGISLEFDPAYSPSISPNGQKVAARCGTSFADICVNNTDNTGFVHLTNDEEFDDNPSWSPDGTQISFWSAREIDGVLTSGIWVINADGNNLHLLTPISQGYDPTWVGTTENNAIYYFDYDSGLNRYNLSNDSSTLVIAETEQFITDFDYAVDNSGNHWVTYASDCSLVLRNLSQNGNPILYQHPPADEDWGWWTDGCISRPLLSPDATRLTYLTGGITEILATYTWGISVNNLLSGTAQRIGTTPSTDPAGFEGDWGYAPAPAPISITGKLTYVKTSGGNKDVWVMENFTNQQTQLSNHPAPDSNPELSPNGQYAAFVTERYGGGNKEIVVKPVADGLSDIHLQRLTNNNNVRDDNPTWSPDGQRIAFFSSRSPSGIWVMNADGSNPQPVFSGIYITDLSWSPVGNELVYTDYDFENDSNGIFTIDMDNPVPVLLDGNLADDRQPAWSPDGEQITFTSNRDGRFNIYVMDADGSNVEIITTNNVNEDNVYPAWSPNGEQIVFTSFVPEFSTDAFYDYSATKTFLRIYERNTSQASSEMNLPVLSQGAVPQRLQSTTTWSPIPYYSAGQKLDYTEMAWRGLTQVDQNTIVCTSSSFQSVNIRENPSITANTSAANYSGTVGIIGYYHLENPETSGAGTIYNFILVKTTTTNVYGWIADILFNTGGATPPPICSQPIPLYKADRIPDISPTPTPTPVVTATLYPTYTPGAPPQLPRPICTDKPTWIQQLCQNAWTYLPVDKRQLLINQLNNQQWPVDFITLDAWWLQYVGWGIADVPPIIWQSESIDQCAGFTNSNVCQSIVNDSVHLFVHMSRIGVDWNNSGLGQTISADINQQVLGFLPDSDRIPVPSSGGSPQDYLWGSVQATQPNGNPADRNNYGDYACRNNRFGATLPGFDDWADVCWVCQDLPTELYKRAGYDLRNKISTDAEVMNRYPNPAYSRYVPAVANFAHIATGGNTNGATPNYQIGEMVFLFSPQDLTPNSLPYDGYTHVGIVVRGNYSGNDLNAALDQVLIAQISYSSQGFYRAISQSNLGLAPSEYVGRFEVVSLRTYLTKHLLSIPAGSLPAGVVASPSNSTEWAAAAMLMSHWSPNELK